MNKDPFVLFRRQAFVPDLVPMLNQNLVKFELDGLSFNDFFFHSWLRYQTIHIYFLVLANPMRSIHSLQINLRIVIRIKNNYVIRWHQIEAETTSLRWNQKQLNLGLRRHKLFDELFSLIIGRISI